MAEVITKFEVRVKYTPLDPEGYKRTHHFSAQRCTFRVDQYVDAVEEDGCTRVLLRTIASNRPSSIRCTESVKEIEEAVEEGQQILRTMKGAYDGEATD
jgi:hypothetical protein